MTTCARSIYVIYGDFVSLTEQIGFGLDMHLSYYISVVLVSIILVTLLIK